MSLFANERIYNENIIAWTKIQSWVSLTGY